MKPVQISKEAQHMDVLGRIWLAAKRCWRVRVGHHTMVRGGRAWKPTGDYRSYMIRFWRTNPTVPWRPAAIDPYHDGIHYFASREALYAFLDAQIDHQVPKT
jgi:hypothetical protein